jgi:cytochrome c-type biogenesis protein CcmH
MGWIVLLVIGAGAFGLALLLGAPRTLGSFIGAALMLGATGYALQGRPGLAGRPTSAGRTGSTLDAGVAELRTKMFGRFGAAEPYFFAADALERTGAQANAVRLLLGGVNAQPNNAALWTGLGTAYAEHDGTVSPAARFAFARAMQLAPDHPGPPYFLGLALVRAGQFREAQRWWARSYAITPDALSYRAEIGRRLTLLEALIASEAGER